MKQELLDYLNAELNTYKNLDKNTDVNVHEFCKDRSALIKNLIAATEAAIFDMPSFIEIVEGALKESVEIKNTEFKSYYTVGFGDGINFILNYKKPESDGK